MKKVLSILLAVVLVFGMLPATALNVFATDEGTWTLVTDASTLAAGDQLVFAETTNTKGDFVAGSLSGKYLTSVAATFSDNTIPSLPTNALVFTLGGSSGSWTFSNNDQLLGSTAAKSLSLTSGTTTWTIDIASNGNATITNTNTSCGKILYNRDSPRFTTYTSNVSVSMLLPQLYRLEVSGGTTEPDPEPGCEHANTVNTNVVEPGCETVGTHDVYCNDCETTIETGVETPATGHNYVDGTCSVCGAAEPVAPEVVFPEIPETGNYELVTDINEITAGGEFVIVANYNDTNYAMNATTSGKPTATEVTVVDGKVAGDAPTWKIGSYDGSIVLFNGTEYLGYGTSGTNFSSSAEPYKWNVVAGENSTYQIISAAVTDRAVTYQKNVQFGAYSTTNASGADYQGYLSLYKKVAGEVEVLTSTLTFMEQGTTTKTETAEATKSYTMPEAVNAAPTGYTFAGWVEAQVLTETALAPETVYAAGDSYTVGNDAAFYALYTRTEVQEGGSATAFIAKDVSEINTDDVVVITMTKAGVIYALPNNGGTSAPAANNIATVNEDGQLIVQDPATVTWVINKNGDNLTFYVNGNAENWLYCTSANNGVKVGTGEDNTFVVDVATGYLMNNGQSRYIGVYNTQDWRCYKLNNGSIATNIANQTLAFYVETAISGSVETTYYTTCVHSYASTNETTLTCQYCGTTKAAAASVNGTAYETVEQAIASAAGTVKLQQAADSITVDGDLYLDVNGFAATNVTATKIYAYNSIATSAAAGTGSITTSSEVVMDNTVNNIRYIALAEGEEETKTYTFHVLEMKLSAVTLRAKVVEENEQIIEENGIYYKATYACDDTLKGKIDSYGVVFSLQDMPGADFKTEENGRNLYTVYEKDSFVSGAEVTSGSIFGIMKDTEDRAALATEQGKTLAQLNAEYGKKDIHANAYIVINGETLVGTGASYSMFDVMDKLDEKWNDLTDAQRTTIQKFYGYWADKGMSAWADEFENIA